MPALIARTALALAVLGAAGACAGTCPSPPAAAGTASAASAELDDPELLSRAEALAREVCECPSALCADSQAASFVDLLGRRGENLSAETRDKLFGLAETVLGCRVRLAYPSEPDDMDGAGSAGASGAAGAASGAPSPAVDPG